VLEKAEIEDGPSLVGFRLSLLVHKFARTALVSSLDQSMTLKLATLLPSE